jgi:protoheme IX farnesyltransferase
VLGYTGEIYGAAAAVLGTGFVIYAASVLAAPLDDPAMKAEKTLFAFSILYLFGIFAAYLADAVVGRIIAAGGI